MPADRRRNNELAGRPKPLSDGDKFALALGLAERPQIFGQCKEAFRRAADESFNFDLPLFQQTDAMKAYVEKVVSAFPGFFNDGHENHRERIKRLEIYAMSYLKKSGKMMYYTTDKDKKQKKHHKDKDETVLSPLPPLPSRPSIIKVERPRPKPLYRGAKARNDTMAPPPPPPPPPPPTTPADNATTTISDVGALSKFLAACQPSMVHRLAAFHSAGVFDGKDLIGMANWGQGARKFVKDHLAQTPLEVEAIRIGLVSRPAIKSAFEHAMGKSWAYDGKVRALACMRSSIPTSDRLPPLGRRAYSMHTLTHTADGLGAVFGPVNASPPPTYTCIDLEAIAALAAAARHRSTPLFVPCTVAPIPKSGSFNVVWFIDFADGIQWVFRTPINPTDEWSLTDEKSMRSDFIAIQLIQSRTTIPIPPIYDFCATPDNPIGRPYMLMESVKGTQLCELWFDPVWFTEDRRKTVFRSLVGFMSQLRVLEFPSIGSLDLDPSTNSHVVVPEIIPPSDDTDATVWGPYNTVHAYLMHAIERKTTSTEPRHKVSLWLLRLFAGALPDHSLDGPPFVLSMPDFNFQNIFVNDNGEVTGLIDWDGITVGPRQGGYARYPSWITRDWDPLMYVYPMPKDDESSVDSEDSDEDSEDEGQRSAAAQEGGQEIQIPSAQSEDGATTKEADEKNQIPLREELKEDSPATLQMFRDEYLAVFEEIDPTSAQYTRNSHVFEALEIGISSWACRGQILHTLTKYVFGHTKQSYSEPLSWLSLEEGIGVGDWLNQVSRRAS
ncbi:kinase-like domain-containing protein [Mycena galopus ATCC 62051]|nr:kinase-like domain-containing protein [Mycena galopus ATCC 62051]